MTATPPALPSALAAYLRPLQIHDAAAWSAYLNRPGVIEHTSWGDISPAALATLINGYVEGGEGLRWAIVEANGSLLGTVGLNEIARAHGRAELAYDLDPRYQGRGLATHAARAVVNWAHDAMDLQRIQATVLDSNASSIAVLERIGMQCEGVLHQYRKVRGQARDYWMYAAVQARQGTAPPRPAHEAT
ncbi:ribosomal-protein-alanine N-acetyltransferase [Achromobacter deleyi]|uniref:GNAT family N-acetyltransferase n=1 Tax=Achromobacter deleyi TaxID=1353891 RepID=UPI002859C93E|nr:GNAT family protein [Achromobacter deleyi]MDR6599410.1 ribosomal-protein-alanine N-acetyltransferase [Achromobacter deleyi]